MLSSRLCFFSFLLLRRYRAASIHVTTTKMIRTPRTTDSTVTTVPENKASKIEKEKGIYKVLNHNHKLNTIIGIVGLRNTIIEIVGLRNTIIGMVGLRLVYRCPLVTVKKATIYIQASFQFLLLDYLLCSQCQNMARLMFTLVF